MKLSLPTLALVILMTVFSCSSDDNLPTRFTNVSAKESGVDFENSLIETDQINAYTFLYLYNGAGVGIGDFDNDGLNDIFLGGNMTSSKLYLNQGDFKFSDITKSAGLVTSSWVHGVSIVDINNDGWADIYLSVGGLKSGEKSRNLLYVNNQDQSFTESAAAYGLADQSLTTHSAFFDFDLDGDLDVYLINYENDPSKDPNAVKPKKRGVNFPSSDKLYRNDGENGFVDISASAGIDQEGYGLGLSISDFNNDGWPDIYVSNDFLYDDFFYINNQKGGFEDQSKQYLRHTSNFGMGIDIADVNNDGLLDIMQVDMLPENNRRQKKLLSGMNYDRFVMSLNADYSPQYMRNSLQVNNGAAAPFSELGELTGLSKTDWSWAPLIADFDNDGLNDIFITNGYAKDVTDVDFRNYVANATRESGDLLDSMVVIKALRSLEGEPVPNYMFKNHGELEFSNQAENWGFEKPSFSTGAAYADLDNDGDLDIVVNNINQKAFLYRNNTFAMDSTHYLKLDVKNGFGIKAELFIDGAIQKKELNPYRGFQSSVDPIIHFGLGKNVKIDSLILTWPNGITIVEKNVLSNQTLIFEKPEQPNIDFAKNYLSLAQSNFEDITDDSGVDFLHKESEFVDFYREPLLPHQFSQNGPCAVIGDVNNDGFDDLFIGGAAGQSGELFVQNRSGKFLKNASKFDEAYEDSDALFFDLDNDGDLDLFVASGSNEFDSGSGLYQDRIYENNGAGEFTKVFSALPRHAFSTSVVVANDFDGDGDLDLFLGGALDPGKYPMPGNSQLLLNESGVFKDVTSILSSGLDKIGMVKGAKWADLNSDGNKELVLTGEFMGIYVYEWNGKSFVDNSSKFGMNEFKGWWNTIEIADLDNDGDLDIVAGNQGLNTRFKGTPKEPINVYAKDFDNNGRLDAILTTYVEGIEQLAYDKTTLSNQINAIKKKYRLNLDFAAKDFTSIFDAEELSDAFKLTANHMLTSVFINDGTGAMAYIPMPIEAQFSQVNSILIDDFNADGHLDLLFGGNSFSPDVFTGRNDAQATLMLEGKGDGTFIPMKNQLLGLVNTGVVSAILSIEVQNQSVVLIARNNDRLKLYQKSKLTTSLKKRVNTQIR